MNIFTPQANISIATNRNFSQSIELLFEFVKRDIKAKYKNTFLGVIWVVLQPLLLALFFVILREKLLNKIPDYHEDYILMFSALIIWQFFSTSFQRGSVSIEANNHLIYRIKFPKVLLPLSVLISALFDSLINILIFFVFLLLFKKVFLIGILYLFFVLLVGSFFIAALMLFFSVLICFFADLKHLVPLLIQLSLFGLPIIYDKSIVPHEFREIYQNIPLVWMVTKTKEVISGSMFTWNYSATLVLFYGVLSLIVAYLFYRRLEKFIIDYI